MKKIILSFLTTAVCISGGYAQEDLFGTTEKKPARKGVVFTINAGLDQPGGDMAKRFGTSYRLGGGVMYKTASNWMFGPKIDFIVGNKIKEDSLMINLKDANGFLIDQNGYRKGVGTFERGYMIGVQAGKIFNFGKKSSDNGLLALTSVGFMQHKINIFERSADIVQINKENRKGYDRLTNGIFIEEYIAYTYFANDGLINFHIGLDITAGFTKGRRDYLYDVMRPDDKQRIDILFGIRGGWYIPIFKRKSEEFFFE
ncbi:MAG TPA: hypothetical protein VGD89_09175 [Flavipsychrobacter sp.]